MIAILQRFGTLLITSVAVLNMAAGCTLPPPFNGLNGGPSYLLGVLKKDPSNSQIQKSGFVKANAVKSGDQVNTSGLSTLNGQKIVEMSKNNLFLLTTEKGVFGSKDGGTTWERKYLFSIDSTENDQTKKDQDIASKIARNDAVKVRDFVVNPNNNDNIYLATLDNDNLGKIFETNNGGKDFKLIYSEVNSKVGVSLITLDPKNPLRIFAVLDGGALLRSMDGGTNWTKMITFDEVPIAINFVKEYNDYFYVLLPKKGLLKGQNDGLDWSPVITLKAAPNTSSKVKSEDIKFSKFTKIKPVITSKGDNSNPSWLLLADQQLFVASQVDGTYTRIVLPVQSDSSSILDIAYDTKEGVNHLYASLRDKLLESRNTGQGWSWNASDNIQLSDAIGNISTILISKENSDSIYLLLNKPPKKQT